MSKISSFIVTDSQLISQMRAMLDPVPRRERRRPQISCTECRRRKQKCHRPATGACTNCVRRYPPVECFVQALEDRSPANQSSQRQRPSPIDEPRLQYPAIPLSRILHPYEDSVSFREQLLSQTSPGVREELQFERGTSAAHRELEFLDPDAEKPLIHRPPLSSPRCFGGVLTNLNSFTAIPVRTTLRNAELFHFFHQYVTPRFCSIDGSSMPALFVREIKPWMIQSPMMPSIAILMASASQGLLREPDAEQNSETLSIKSHVLGLVNQFIRQDFHIVGNQALRIVIHLVVSEFFWGNAENIWPHMEGIKQMLRIRGGLYAMNDPLNMHVLIVTDYELSCAFERELCFQSVAAALAAELPIQETYPAKLRCPLLAYPVSFQACVEDLSLSREAADILDDVRFLTTSITSCLLFPDIQPVKTSKIQSTAAWLHKRIEDLPKQDVYSDIAIDDVIFDTIRITALVYTLSIKNLVPMSAAYSPALIDRFHFNVSYVGLSNWKNIPGIFLWMLLVATPTGKDDYRGRFVRKQMACTGMALGLEDFFLGTAYLRAFWLVQRWIENERLQACE